MSGAPGDASEGDDELDVVEMLERPSLLDADRLTFPVGARQDLPRVGGRYVGDDMSWRGSHVTRAVAINTAGSSGCMTEWGRHWGRALADMGADLAVLSETRIRQPEHHVRAVNGLLESGYIAVSHNTSSPDRLQAGAARPPRGRPGTAASSPEDDSHDTTMHGPLAAGVVLAVRRLYCGELSEITRGPHGRGLAGNVTLQDGSVLRGVGMYGVTGATAPNFTSLAGKVTVEKDIRSFLLDQAVMCDDHGWHMVVLGDMNSFTDPDLDRLGGPVMIREESVAMTLDEIGAQDSFRARHPGTTAYTYVHHSGCASRLDQVWVRPGIGTNIPVLNSAILWAWPRRRDHDPVLADLWCRIPVVDDDGPPRPRAPWRCLVTEMNNEERLPALRSEVESRIAPHQDAIERARQQLTAACMSVGRSPTGSLPTVRQQEYLPDLRAQDTRRRINHCQRVIEGARGGAALRRYQPMGSADARHHSHSDGVCAAMVHPARRAASTTSRQRGTHHGGRAGMGKVAAQDPKAMVSRTNSTVDRSGWQAQRIPGLTCSLRHSKRLS